MTEAATAPAVFRFGRCELRAAERVLLVGGAPAALGARAFDVLLALVERRDRVVAKSELLELVWPGLVVEENNLQVQISTLRKLLGPKAIATIPGRGYHFVEAVEGAAAASGGAAAPTTVPPLPPSNLPVEPPLLFGREQELADVGQLVRVHRLVTLTGAGGIGKTQLARAAAHALRGEFADGVWSIELSPIADAESVLGAVARALDVNLPAGRPPQQVLAEALAGQQLLLVLDNCEHVLDRIAQLAQALLAHAPGVHVLATSQEPLKLPAEQQYRLGTLAVPSSSDMATALQYGAVALFAERARAIDPRFALTAQNLSAVIDICRHLDGIPLAIELAAARVPLLGINGLRERLGERFRVLTAGSRIALRRHQTLHAALDWSHGLLSADEQAIFRRLGVFAGGWTLEAAQQVAADERIDAWAVLEHLGALVDKSLVVAHGAEAPRYTLLETTRAYALEKLAQAGETAPLLTRHAQVTLALFERAHDERWGEQGTLSAHDYTARVQPEVDNLRAALAWARSGSEPAPAAALAAALAQALDMVGLAAEGLTVLREFMPLVTDAPDDPVAARFWFAATSLGTYGRIDDDDYLRALDLAEQGCRANGWIRQLYGALLMRAWWHVRKHEFAAAEAALAQAEAVEQPHWPGWLRSDYWNARVYLMVQRADHALLPAAHQRIASLLPAAGEEGRRARLIVNMAVDCAYRQQWHEAVTLLEPALDQARERRRPAGNVAWGLGILVLALAELGRLDAARERLRQGLPLWRADGIVRVWLPAAIRLLAAEGRIAAAARLLGANEGGEHREGSGGLMTRVNAESLRLIEAAAPDAAQRERWRREGEALTEDEIAALCLGDANPAR